MDGTMKKMVFKKSDGSALWYFDVKQPRARNIKGELDWKIDVVNTKSVKKSLFSG